MRILKKIPKFLEKPSRTNFIDVGHAEILRRKTLVGNTSLL